MHIGILGYLKKIFLPPINLLVKKEKVRKKLGGRGGKNLKRQVEFTALP